MFMYYTFLNNMDIFVKQLSDNGTFYASQHKQDRHAIDNIFSRKKNGYFLDVGASDGISENNTVLMERYYGWDGICFEGDPRNIEKLCNNRKCHIAGSPVYNKSGILVPFELHNTRHLSGISGYQYYRSVCSNVAMLSTTTLMDCIKLFNAPHVIDYMSMDIEGSEYEALSTFDFDNYVINYIALEHNFQEPKRENIKKLLTSHNYAYFRSIQHDDDYIYIPYAKANNIIYPMEK